MRKFIVVLAACCLLGAGQAAQGQALRAGVVEFEEKNSIGLENARVIVPEHLVSFLKELGKYRLSERIYLKKAFEEQKLQTTGAVDDKTAVEFGKIAGLQAVITGSVMKVGGEITVSGRVINTGTGEIIAAGAVKFGRLGQLMDNMEELAYLLSGFSQDRYRAIKAKKLIGKTRYGLQLGTGYALSGLDLLSASAFSPLALGAFYHSRRFDADLFAAPVSKAAHVSIRLAVNPFTHLGFGVGYQIIDDGMAKNLDKNAYYGQYQSALLGVNYRASHRLRASLYLGAPVGGYIQFWPKDTTYNSGYKAYEYYYKVTSGISAGIATLEYSVSDDLALSLLVQFNGGEGWIDHKHDDDFIKTRPNQFGDNVFMETTTVSLMLGYNLPF
ncbi:MAG: CsgG/HfaB family protein [Candidatus Edwardsbacteria bacterium]|nr:CsgG/HfaB family protein [Candidatus Edwardsbacteria bacterium]